MISMLISVGSCNCELFIAYIEHLLCSELTNRKVVIADNTYFHKSSRINQLIESNRCRLLYLPRYSPKRNWVEKILIYSSEKSQANSMRHFRYLRRYFRRITPNSKFWTILAGLTIVYFQ